MNKGAKIAVGIWDVIYPLALYYAATIILMFAAQMVIGTENEKYMICEIIASAITIPVMYQSFYKPDKILHPFASIFESQAVDDRRNRGNSENIGSIEIKEKIGTGIWYRDIASKAGVKNVLCIIILAALIGIGLNNVILMSPLAGMSSAYEEASSHFYGGTFALELIGSACLTPILEELVYRGIIYARLKRLTGMIPAMIGASLIFAIMHFNIVQFVYALLFGFVLILFMERTGHVYGAIIGHITANAIAVVRTETGILEATVDKSAAAWVTSVGCLAMGLLGLLLYIRKKSEPDK